MISTAHRIRSTDGIDGKDAVGLYLDGIAKTALLTAAEEVILAKRIEAGLFARQLLNGTVDDEATRPHGASAEELEQIDGIGAEMARQLARKLGAQGALVLAARNGDLLNTVAQQCTALGAQVLVVPTDVSVEAQCRALVAQTVQRFGRVDALINNAGISAQARSRPRSARRRCSSRMLRPRPPSKAPNNPARRPMPA